MIQLWFDVLNGNARSNWEFFNLLNSGWLQMEFRHRYGDNPTEKEQWQWMWENAETIKLSAEDYDHLIKKLNLNEDAT